MQNQTKKTIWTYVISILIPLVVGGLSALLTASNMNLFDTITKPPLSPPAVLFPIVWTILYILMGISQAMIWLKREQNPTSTDRGIYAYAISLTFNFFWSIFFFNFKWFLFSAIWLIALLVLIVATIYFYKKVKPLSAYLQILYLIWVTFAGYLNIAIYLLN